MHGCDRRGVVFNSGMSGPMKTGELGPNYGRCYMEEAGQTRMATKELRCRFSPSCSESNNNILNPRTHARI